MDFESTVFKTEILKFLDAIPLKLSLLNTAKTAKTTKSAKFFI